MREAKKAVKIVSELTTYFLDKGATEIEIDLIQNRDNVCCDTIISFQGILRELSNKELKKVKKQLTTSREVQFEEYYWELAGEGNHSQELSLVGMLIDRANIEYENNELKITLWKKD